MGVGRRREGAVREMEIIDKLNFNFFVQIKALYLSLFKGVFKLLNSSRLNLFFDLNSYRIGYIY